LPVVLSPAENGVRAQGSHRTFGIVQPTAIGMTNGLAAELPMYNR
jgi:hypothetical protein